ncbi:MAG: S1 RNA-binding domain-containing protein [Chloroflexi bacterium]|nr:S1 RNA-binding domain-containing protein [Chloroflexota bacterium]
MLRVGEEIDVYVLSLDRDANRIALSRKRLLEDPWEIASDRYHEGQLVEGTVTNVVDFGAFVALDDGLEGLLHLSEMGDGSLKEPYSYVKKGDRLSLRISHLEPEKRRVGFTQRWGTEGAEGAAPEAAAPDAEAADSSATASDTPAAEASEAPADAAPTSVVDETANADADTTDTGAESETETESI